jgi:hypothetical protein
MSEVDSSYDPHGSALPENDAIDITGANSLRTAANGFDSRLDAIVKGGGPESNLDLSSLKGPSGQGAPSGDLGLRRGRKSPVLYNAATKEFSVAGRRFAEEDYQSAVESESALLDENAKPIRPNDGGDWRTVSTANFINYINQIKNPTRGQLFKKNFGMGVEQVKSLGGSALAAFGAEDTGFAIAEEADKRAGYYQPFVREFTDIKDGGDTVDWFVSVLGSQGPQILESVAAAGVGAVAGSAVAGPGVGTFGGFVSGLFGKKAFKESVKKAAGEYRKRKAAGWTRREIAADPKFAAEMKLLKSAGSIAGATVANVASGYTMGVGDIFGEAVDQENADGSRKFTDGDARVKALFGAIPYAGLEALPEVVAAAKLLGAPAVRAARKVPKGDAKLRTKALSKAKDIAGGAAQSGA